MHSIKYCHSNTSRTAMMARGGEVWLCVDGSCWAMTYCSFLHVHHNLLVEKPQHNRVIGGELHGISRIKVIFNKAGT